MTQLHGLAALKECEKLMAALIRRYERASLGHFKVDAEAALNALVDQIKDASRLVEQAENRYRIAQAEDDISRAQKRIAELSPNG